MTVALSFLLGGAAAFGLWRLLQPSFSTPLFLRENFRGRMVPTAAGVAIPIVVVAAEAVRAVLAAEGVGRAASMAGVSRATVVASLGFALVGVLDDVAGDSTDRGFRGHVAALRDGRLTTGGLKLAGGALVAIAAAAAVRPATGAARLLADGALIALAANLGNLFDRAPGRVVKVSVVAFVVLALATSVPPRLAPVAVVVGAAVGLLADDLRERLMLGDAGANAMGAALGVGVVALASPGVRLAVLAAVMAANAASEFVSFSRVIDAVPPLRALDRAGRAP